jgi:outer membrane receptor protein involved in Fe transport
VQWKLAGHTVGITARYIDSYRDDSENTVEERGAETIPSWTVYDLEYGFSTDLDLLVLSFELGALNVLDTDPPPVESPLGYEVGVHDPRGRIIYSRLRGEF